MKRALVLFVAPVAALAVLIPLPLAIALPTPRPAADAAPLSALCVINHVVSLSPGISSTPGQSDFATQAGTGTIDCHGTAGGQPITGPGTYAVVGKLAAGPMVDFNCAQGGGFGTQTFSLPTGGGSVTITEPFTFTYVAAAGHFGGQALGGAFEFTPVVGDCISTPLTLTSVRGEAALTA
jgi:hypothetical protein